MFLKNAIKTTWIRVKSRVFVITKKVADLQEKDGSLRVVDGSLRVVDGGLRGEQIVPGVEEDPVLGQLVLLGVEVLERL